MTSQFHSDDAYPLVTDCTLLDWLEQQRSISLKQANTWSGVPTFELVHLDHANMLNQIHARLTQLIKERYEIL